MSPLETLGFALGTSFASGLNLYATVAAGGAVPAARHHHLPEPLQVLAHPLVIGVAIALFVVEFVADKIPYVDSVWDAVTPSSVRPRPPSLLQRLRGRRPGAVEDRRRRCWPVRVALTSHGAKATTRAAANVSPEPVSNWTLERDRGRDRGISLLAGGDAPADHGRRGRGAGDPRGPADLAAVPGLSGGAARFGGRTSGPAPAPTPD